MRAPPCSDEGARRKTAGFTLPKPTAILDLAMDDGAPIRVVRHGNSSGPRVVLSHGNGFASDSYFPFWRLMLERFDLALFDFRNCGRNPFHASEPHHYPRFARESATVHGAIANAWGEKTTVGVFHSMSATAALLAVVDGIWHWDALVLFDPPVVPPEGNPLRASLMNEGRMLRDAALIRQNRFADPDELVDVYRYLYRFRRLRMGVAELNARSTLRFDPESGEWLLCCPGPVEADLYTEVADLPIWRKPRPPERPLLIVGSGPESEARTRRSPHPVANCSASHSASITPPSPAPRTFCSSRSRSGASPCSTVSSPTNGSPHERFALPPWNSAQLPCIVRVRNDCRKWRVGARWNCNLPYTVCLLGREANGPLALVTSLAATVRACRDRRLNALPTHSLNRDAVAVLPVSAE